MATKVGVFESRRHVRLGAIGRHVLSVDCSRAVLAAHGLVEHALRTQRLNRAQDFRLLVVHRVGVKRNRRLHGGKRNQLKDVVRHHVAQRAGLLVVSAAQLDAELFRHGDLHVVHIAPIPDRLENAVGEPEGQNILHRFFAEIMIDAVNLLFVEHLRIS